MSVWPDEDQVRRLERHEAKVHAMRAGRSVRELDEGILVTDEADPDPFWNRLESVRLPEDEAVFRRELDRLIVLFATLGRRPHIWSSPGYHRPADLERRLAETGWVDLGRGLLMALTDPDAARAAARRRLPPGVTVERFPNGAAERTRVAAAEIALVSGEAFGVEPAARGTVEADALALFDRSGFAAYIVRADGEPAAVAKATTFDGATYLSTIGTRPAYRGRGFAALATAAACVEALELGSEWTYLGVHEANAPARRLYSRLGFEDIGEPAGDWIL